MARLPFVYPFAFDRHLGSFYFLAITDKAAMNIQFLLDKYYKSRMDRSHNKYMFTFLRNHQTVFPR